MRLWSLDPAMLDRQGLTACWREALLAQAVLAGKTKGYRSHPQLERFREHPSPLAAVGDYLAAVADEAAGRGYRFDGSKILERQPDVTRIEVTTGQLALEHEHLLAKLELRSPAWRPHAEALRVHPLFVVTEGPIASWERNTTT